MSNLSNSKIMDFAKERLDFHHAAITINAVLYSIAGLAILAVSPASDKIEDKILPKHRIGAMAVLAVAFATQVTITALVNKKHGRGYAWMASIGTGIFVVPLVSIIAAKVVMPPKAK